MQMSRFVVSYKDVRPGEHVLYNVLEDRYAGVDDLTLRAVARWAEGAAPADATELETQEILFDDGFLVHAREEDDARLRAHLEAASEGVPGMLYVTLMPTLQCNLACSYCFQKENPAFTKMSSPTEDATLEWILRQIDARALRHLKIHYFGGEPTTRKDYCLRTAEVLSASMSARGGTFEWQMTTNGVLLDVQFAKAMERFGKGQFKITLDGDKETHDKERVYRDGRGSFDVIFENVVALAEAGCKVRIGGNFFPDQAASFEKLLDRIERSGVAQKLQGVRFKPARPLRAALEEQLHHRPRGQRLQMPGRRRAAGPRGDQREVGRGREDRAARRAAAVGAVRRLPVHACLRRRVPGRAVPQDPQARSGRLQEGHVRAEFPRDGDPSLPRGVFARRSADGSSLTPTGTETQMKIKRSKRKSTRRASGCTVMVDMIP